MRKILALALFVCASAWGANYSPVMQTATTCDEGQAMTKTSAGWTCTTVSGGGVPSGAVLPFNLANCPAGWTELTAARGRVIVGVPASGTLAATVGTALTDAQDKSVTPTFTGTPFSSVINHTHPVTDPGHVHTQASTTTSTGSASNRLGTADTSSTAQNTGSATTGVTTNNPVGGVASITPAGTLSAVSTSSVIATIQFRYCTKD